MDCWYERGVEAECGDGFNQKFVDFKVDEVVGERVAGDFVWR